MISLFFSRPLQTLLMKAQTFILPPFFIHRNLARLRPTIPSPLSYIQSITFSPLNFRGMKSTLGVLLFVFSLTSAVVYSEEDSGFSSSSINCRSRNFATGMDAIVRCDIAVEEYDELTRYPTCVFIQTKTQKYQSCIQLNKIAQTDCNERCIPRSKMIGKSEGTYCCCTSDMCNEEHNLLS